MGSAADGSDDCGDDGDDVGCTADGGDGCGDVGRACWSRPAQAAWGAAEKAYIRYDYAAIVRANAAIVRGAELLRAALPPTDAGAAEDGVQKLAAGSVQDFVDEQHVNHFNLGEQMAALWADHAVLRADLANIVIRLKPYLDPPGSVSAWPSPTRPRM